MLEKHSAVPNPSRRDMAFNENILVFEQSVFFSCSTRMGGEAVFWYISAR